MKDGKARSAPTRTTATPVTRHKVAIARQGAENLNRSSKEHNYMAAEMAKLRSEAIQARRLAEHIQMLANPAGTGKREHKPMTTSLGNREHAQEKRRHTDNRATGGSQLSFNPLHPSSELPPEQLIRLLGLETKKTRKQQKSRKPTSSKQLRPKPENGPETETSLIAENRPSRKKGTRKVADSQVFGGKRPGFLLPSIVAGALAGAAISAYLFLGETPSSAETPRNASTAPAGETSPGTKSHAVIGEKSVPQPIRETARPFPDVSPEQIQAEQRRLRLEAEQRLAERQAQLAVARELAAESPPDPVLTEIQADTPVPVKGESIPIAVSAPIEATAVIEETENVLPESSATEPQAVDIEDASLSANVPEKAGDAVTGDKDASQETVAPDIEATAPEAATPSSDTELF